MHRFLTLHVCIIKFILITHFEEYLTPGVKKSDYNQNLAMQNEMHDFYLIARVRCYIVKLTFKASQRFCQYN